MAADDDGVVDALHGVSHDLQEIDSLPESGMAVDGCMRSIANFAVDLVGRRLDRDVKMPLALHYRDPSIIQIQAIHPDPKSVSTPYHAIERLTSVSAHHNFGNIERSIIQDSTPKQPDK